MFKISGAKSGDFVLEAQKTAATYWRSPANSVATPATLAPGSVVVIDAYSRGAYIDPTDSTQTARSSVGGTPAYVLTQGSNRSAWANVVCADPAAATRNKALVYVGTSALSPGVESTEFAYCGWVGARVADGVAKGNGLSIDTSAYGVLKVAAQGDTIVAFAEEANSSGAAAIRRVLLLDVGHQAYAAGTA